METLLTIGLLLACTLLALQAERWRRRAKTSEAHAMGMAMQMGNLSQENYNAGWEASRRHTMGLLYKIATRADREGRDAFATLREVSAQAEAESIVQVPKSA